MRAFLISIGTIALAATLAAACGGSSEDDSSGTGAASGSGGASGGSGGSSGSAGSGGASGGSSGASGSSGSGSGGTAGSGGSPGPECSQASDCKGFQDCCSCMAVPNSVNPPGCDAACTDERCKVLGVDVNKVACVAGRCVMNFDCDTSKVACKMAEPQCPPGTTPQVSINCYTGECVDASQCEFVPDCAKCATEEACSVYQTQIGLRPHCVSIPAGCGSDTSCTCLGPTTCVGGFNSCQDLSGVKGVSCDCPAC